MVPGQICIPQSANRYALAIKRQFRSHLLEATIVASKSAISTAVPIEAYLRQHNDQFGREYPLGCQSAGPSGYNNDSSDLREVDPKRRSRCWQKGRSVGQITTQIRPQNAVQMLSKMPKIVSKCCPNSAHACPIMPKEKAIFSL